MVIGFECITSSKYEQRATLLRPGDAAGAEQPVENEPGGYWKVEQHPLTGQVIRTWVEYTEDNPDTPENETKKNIFECQARAIVTGGLNSQGTTQRWDSKGDYVNVDYVELQVPPDLIITKNDRVTSITDSRGNVIWKEEEFGSMKPTVFNVRGVSPVVDPFGSVTEQFVLLERAEVQGG